ncbi:Hamartin [Acipenser ruthenus]|uniref:Hamartin n=1 Tax=Acipenser ruthenus TaxID=7906 RepID=A0A444UYD3_ACIRT|nr:Hamartin [Acipenser ruthenus]
MQSLKDSLQDEQLRYQQQREEHEMMVSRLHSQTKQLQQGRDEYYAKSQELQSKLVECQKEMGMLRAELQKANKKVCNKGHLLNLLSQKCPPFTFLTLPELEVLSAGLCSLLTSAVVILSCQLTSSETVQQQLEFLNKRLLLLGEANELYAEELRHSNPDNTKEVEMMQASHKKELDKMKQSAVQQSQRLEAAQKRIAELESQLAKKEHLLLEQKKYLEDVKTQANSSSTPFSTPLLALSQLSGTQPPYRSPQTSRRLPEPSQNGKADSWKPGLTRQENIRDSEKGTSDEANNLGGESENLKTVTLNELPEFIKELELEQDQRKLEEREEDAFTEELYEITAAKRESPTLRGGFDSPFYRTTETLTGNQKKPVAHPAPMAASSCGQNTNSTPDKQAGQPVGGQEPCFFKPVFTPIEGPLQEPFRSHSPPAADEGNNQGKYSLFTPSPCKAQAAPYEPLFDLALPKAAALFVGRRTAEAVRRAGAERLVEEEEEEEEGEASTSPLEVLDRLIQQGGDMHVKELKR